jgi:tetratricopeptide (TPR) repeat protein
MGVLAVGVGKVEEALPFFKTALEVNQTIGQFWLSYINALIKLDRLDDAKVVLGQAKSAGAKGDGFDKVESSLENVAKVKGDQTDKDILEKAVHLRENGKYDEAIDLLFHHTKQSPADPNLEALISQCYILKDNLEQAKIHLDSAKNINPNIASVGWNETRILLKQKKVNEALAVADKTNKLFPDDVEGMGVLGSCLRAKGNFDEGLKYLNKAIELNPNYAEVLINRGLIYLNKDDKANALADLEKAHKLKPHLREIWNLVLNLKIELKKFEDAISLGEEMVKIDPLEKKTMLV